MAHPLDEYPIHQVPLSMEYTGTSDRDFYDRNIFHVIPHGQLDMQLIMGYGVYPNLGVKDAYVCVRMGSTQHVMRTSDALDDNRLDIRCGPFRIEVIKPLEEIRVVSEGSAGEVACDLTWHRDIACIDEPTHISRKGPKILLEASRFCGIGTWEGEIAVAGETIAVDREHFTATRDRSWGIRPIGQNTPNPRIDEEHPPELHWFWIPIRFEDRSMMFIIQENGDGERSLNCAAQYTPVRLGGGSSQLGFPEVDVTYKSGTRQPVSATVHAMNRRREPVTVDVEVLGSMPLNVGCGYGGDPDWGHGRWMGRDYCERVTYDLDDPAVKGRAAFSVVDHVSRFTCGGQVGYGIFEHGSLGAHRPSGFTDFFSVAE